VGCDEPFWMPQDLRLSRLIGGLAPLSRCFGRYWTCASAMVASLGCHWGVGAGGGGFFFGCCFGFWCFFGVACNIDSWLVENVDLNQFVLNWDVRDWGQLSVANPER